MSGDGRPPRLLSIAMGYPGVLVAARVILPGDDAGLLPAEEISFAAAAPVVRRRGAAARIAARALLGDLGTEPVALPRRLRAPPLWPPGFVGSLSHADAVAVAAVAPSSAWQALGIDVEPAEPLPADVAGGIATATERQRYDIAGLDGRRLVVAKEAAYKAAFALSPTFLDWADIEVDLAAGEARLAGRSVSVELAEGVVVDGGPPHIVALAAIAA